jgi:hypothetical protein
MIKWRFKHRKLGKFLRNHTFNLYAVEFQFLNRICSFLVGRKKRKRHIRRAIYRDEELRQNRLLVVSMRT